MVLFHSVTETKYTSVQNEDEINSISEFIIEVTLEIEDQSPGDEREAESEFFNLSKLLSINNPTSVLMSRQNLLITEIYLPDSYSGILPDSHSAITCPPPESSL